MPKSNLLRIGSLMIKALKNYLKYTEVMQVLLEKSHHESSYQQ